MRHRLTSASLAALLAAGTAFTGCEKPVTVESLMADHHDEITAYIERVHEVGDHLDEAPTEAAGFDVPAGTITTANTVVVVESDFEELRTDSIERNLHDWGAPQGAVRPSTTDDLGYLVDHIREGPSNPPNRNVDVMNRALGMMRSTRFVAVPRALDVTAGRAAGTVFTSSAWRGLVRVYDMEQGRWVGAVTVSVRDTRETTTHSNITGPVGRAVDRTIADAIRTGADAEGTCP